MLPSRNASLTGALCRQLTPTAWCRKELAHVRLHDGTEYAAGHRDRAEVEAESVAYVVCCAAGLTTAAYSFGYVAHWSGGDTGLVKTTAERVVTCARTILDRAGLLTHADDEDNTEARAA